MPEIIQSLWIGRPLSLIEQLAITSFLQNGHEFHLYCYADVANIPAGAKVLDGSTILPASEIFRYRSGSGRGSVSAFSNLFRYKLLLENGGWWADTDVVCLLPFDFAEPVVIASEHTPSGTRAATAAIRLPRGHAIAQRCYDAARRKNPRTVKWGETGPQLLDRIVSEGGFRASMKGPQDFCPVPYWEWESLLQPQGDWPPAMSGAHAIHLWHELWRRKGVELRPAANRPRALRLWRRWQQWAGFKSKPSVDDETTPFAQLLRRYGLRKPL